MSANPTIDSCTVETSDGIKLHTTIFKPNQYEEQEKSSWVVILVHPYSILGGNQGLLRGIANGLSRKGYKAVTFNMRGVGRSTGKPSIFGFKEIKDVVAVCKWSLENLSVNKILLVGSSAGAPIAGSAVEQVERIVGYVSIGYPFGLMASILFGRHHKNILKSPKPKLFIMGTQDGFTSIKQLNNKLRCAAGRVEKHLIEASYLQASSNTEHTLMASNPIPPTSFRPPRTDPLTQKNLIIPGSKSIDPNSSLNLEKLKEKEAKERKEETNKKIASQKAISIILRREATKAVIEYKKKKGNSKKLLPRTVLEALHERITALRWESALKVFELLQEQLWYRPNVGIYIKLIVMLGKCKQPEKAQSLFEMMVEEGCVVNQEAYTALLSAYSRSGLFHKAFSILEEMKNTPNCQPDVFTYTILMKSCLQVYDFDKVQILLSDMDYVGIKPNTVTYNTLIDSYGKAKRFKEMESTLVEMLRRRDCKPDVWTMNSTLRAFGGSGQIEMMEKCYEKFQSAGIEPSIKTFNILLDSYGKTENYEKMSAVMEFMQKYHFSWTIVTYNIVIDAFGRAGDLKQMEFLFRLMQSERIKPNCVTLCSLVRAYGKAGKAEKVGAVLRFIENSDVALDTVFFNCLVDAYGMMGCFVEMKGVLEMMERSGCKPDKITYRSMIKAYSVNGMSSKATEMRNLLASLEKAR